MSSKNETKKGTEIAASPASELFSFDEFDRFFDDFLSRRWPRLIDLESSAGFSKGFPKVDMIDRENEIEVQAALPGVNKDDLDVSVNNRAITIRASYKEEKKEEGQYFHREISRGEFQRTLSLPDNIDDEHVSASFKDGILKVVIPKSEKGKRKSIEIK